MIARLCVIFCFAILICSLATYAHSPQDQNPSSAATSAKKPLTLGDVKSMLRAGLSEDVIIARLRKEGTAFELSAEEMIDLKNAGCTDNIMKVLLDPHATIPTNAPGAPAAAATATSTSSSAASGTAGSGGLPEDVGVYAMVDGKWIEIQPEIISFQSGGLGKSLLTYGLTKGHVNGKVMGPHSQQKLFAPLEFLIRCMEGVSAAEYQLLRLDEKGNRREFRASTGGVIHSSTGAEKNVVPFKFEKIASRTFRIKVADLKEGEYGFLAPGALGFATASTSQQASAGSGSSGKMYTFRIPE